MIPGFSTVLSGLLLAVCAAERPAAVPVAVEFQEETLFRLGARGDNWCIPRAADDSQVTSMCDGDWLEKGRSLHNHLHRVVGGPDGFQRENLPGYPGFSPKDGSWFGGGPEPVGGALYATPSKTPGPAWPGT